MIAQKEAWSAKATKSEDCPWCGGTGAMVCAQFRNGTDPETGQIVWRFEPVAYPDSSPMRFYDKFPGAVMAAGNCVCVQQAIAQRRIDKMLGDPDIPQASLRYDFEDFADPAYQKALGRARQIVSGAAMSDDGEEKPGLLYIGPTGTGKTTLAAIIFRHWIEQGYTAVWTDYTAFIKRIQASYSDHYEGPTSREIIMAVAQADYVVLDDLGAKRPGANSIAPASSDRVEIVYEVLSVREKRRLPTIITSNLEVKELYDHFEARIVSRIRGLCHSVYIGGGDYRAPRDR